jgi:hypothetical protein
MKRPFVLVAVWIVAAAAAVGVGFLAVSLIDASAATPARTGVPAASTGTEPATSSPPVAAPSGEQSTPGGTVYATCTDGTVQLAGAPAAGWSVESAPGQVEFRSGSAKIEVRADCATGAPQFTVENGDGGAPSPAQTTSTDAPAPSPTGVDDHGGRRGGHGSDD